MSGMLAPVGIGITGALLIVGALYSVRMIHRKRRNSFKHQRRKARQPEVRTLISYIFSPSAVGLKITKSQLEVFISFGSNPESPAAAVRTRPCCWPTAPRTSSELTVCRQRDVCQRQGEHFSDCSLFTERVYTQFSFRTSFCIKKKGLKCY